jgi:phage shock protein C
MNMRGNRFEVDRENGKIAGVCAGIANLTGVDATIVRVALVLVTIMGAFPWTLIAYAAAAIVGRPRRVPAFTPIRDRDESRERMRSIDLRMQAIETYVTSSNSKLAREIEELR